MIEKYTSTQRSLFSISVQKYVYSVTMVEAKTVGCAEIR